MHDLINFGKILGTAFVGIGLLIAAGLFFSIPDKSPLAEINSSRSYDEDMEQRKTFLKIMLWLLGLGSVILVICFHVD